MGNQARDFLDPEGPGFGSEGARWILPEGADAVLLGAAYLHHRFALALNRTLDAAPGLSRRDLVERMGGDQPATLDKRLRGVLSLRLEDVVRWWAYAGSAAVPELPKTATDLLPPSHAALLGGWQPGKGRRPPDLRRGSRHLDVEGVLEAIATVLMEAVETGTEHLVTSPRLRDVAVDEALLQGWAPGALRVDQATPTGAVHLTVGGPTPAVACFFGAGTLSVATADDQRATSLRLLENLYALLEIQATDRLLFTAVGGMARDLLTSLRADFATPTPGTSIRLELGWTVTAGLPEGLVPTRSKEVDVELRCEHTSRASEQEGFDVAAWAVAKVQ